VTAEAQAQARLLFELDHVGVAVRDLDAGRERFSRMGFQLTRRSIHSGSRVPGGLVEPWGSGNHTAMLRQGYLEIIGLTDPGLYSSVKDMVARYEGAHIVAIGCREDADAVFQVQAAKGLPLDAPRLLERDAAFGPGGQSVRRARFRNAILPRERYPEARFQYIEHLTRDVLWQPHLLDHPNGARALSQLWFGSDQPALTAERLAPIFGSPAEPDPEGGMRISLSRGGAFVWIVDRCLWGRLMAGAAMPPLPAPVAVGFEVASLPRCEALLAQAALPMLRLSDNAIAVPPEEACGAAIIFSQTKERTA
jgi:hypothetical protein